MTRRPYYIAVNWSARKWDVTNSDGYTVATFCTWRAARRFVRNHRDESTATPSDGGGVGA